MKKNWYLLKSKRYEGPFQLEDLNVRAQQGLISPDDYLISEEDFTKGQMVYKKASQLLPRECFVVKLSVPTLPQIHMPTSSTREIQVRETYKTSSVVQPSLEESISPVKEWFEKISFANAATTCVVVLAAFWFFDASQNQQASRQPAEALVQDSKIKRNVQREIVQKDYRNKDSEEESPRPQKLMPTERPKRNVAQQPAASPLLTPTPRELPANSGFARGTDQRDPNQNDNSLGSPQDLEDSFNRELASEDPNNPVGNPPLNPDDELLDGDPNFQPPSEYDTDVLMEPETNTPMIDIPEEDFN